jgi:hypothetical protein
MTGRTVFAVVVAAVILSSAFDYGAAAVVLGMRAAVDLHAPRAVAIEPVVIEPVVNVCGTNGCAPVQTKRITRRQKKPGNNLPHHI